MVTLKLLIAISASFLFLAKVDGNGTKTVYTVTLGGDGKCLAEVNLARQAAGFSNLNQAAEEADASRLPNADTCESNDSQQCDEWVWKPVCDSLIPNKTEGRALPSGSEGAKFQSGTYAYHVADAGVFNCTAVVDNWKAAYSNFSGLPPAKKDSKDLYSKQDNISFVAMYNPAENATADCRMVTCGKKTSPVAAKNSADSSSGEEASALICMTVPDVLHTDETKAPFTEDQWAQIVTAFEGSASAFSPGVVGLGLAILGLTLL
ncbi:SAG family member [Eimeria brunetti]|uniref:SAG family member n=1 Tax=Eimeria brunetti TaxID=51314 RepID=U6LAS6_9EIME|nr:SAG family member [Eimeria brunetti]